MKYIKAIPFSNPTNKNRFDGKIDYEGQQYEYTIFLTPLEKETPDYDFVVKGISSRRQKGSRKTCLGLKTKIIKMHLNKKITSAYGFVNPVGSNDSVSGSIQLYNWDKKTTGYQVWINDICRHTPKATKKNDVSPLHVLFLLFEQMTAHILGKTEVKLFVERENENILVPLYNKYGFTVDTNIQTSVPNVIAMTKSIKPIDSYHGIPFSTTKGGTNKTRKNKPKLEDI
jgi:hypothetical protein